MTTSTSSALECDLCRDERGGVSESPWPRRPFRPVPLRHVTRETAERLLGAAAEIVLLRTRGALSVRPRENELLHEERRLRAYGYTLPIDRLVRAFDLDETECALLTLLATANRDPRVWSAARALHADPLRLGIDCALAERLLGLPQARLTDAARGLIGLGLVVARTTGGLPLQLTTLFVQPRVVDVLAGHLGLDAELDGLCDLADGGFLVVRASELPRDVAAFALVADAVVREARLADAIVVIDDTGGLPDDRPGLLARFVSAHGRPCVMGR